MKTVKFNYTCHLSLLAVYRGKEKRDKEKRFQFSADKRRKGLWHHSVNVHKSCPWVHLLGTITYSPIHVTVLSWKCIYNCSQVGSLPYLACHRAGHEAIRIIIGGAQLVCPLSSPFSSVSINKKRITHRSPGVAGVTKRWRVFNELSCASGLKTLVFWFW